MKKGLKDWTVTLTVRNSDGKLEKFHHDCFSTTRMDAIKEAKDYYIDYWPKKGKILKSRVGALGEEF
jgi:hypothetical protein